MPAVRSDPYEQLKVHNHNAVRSDSSCSLGKISVDLSNSELYSDRLGTEMETDFVVNGKV